MQNLFKIFLLSLLLNLLIYYPSTSQCSIMELSDYNSLVDSFFYFIPVYQYARPNEVTPQESQTILNKLRPGSAIIVGTERGFITAGLSDKLEKVYLLDYSDNIVLFNLINCSLIKASKNRSDYLKLRFSNNFNDWVNASKSINDEVMQRILGSKDNWKWWNEFISSEDFNGLHINPEGIGMNLKKLWQKNIFIRFAGANYLYIEEQFMRLKNLVDHDLIKVRFVDLASSEQVENFLRNDVEKDEKFTLIDLSNAWENRFLFKKTINLIKTLSFYLLGESIFQFTALRSSSEQKYAKYIITEWKYLGFSFDHIKKLGGAEEFYKKIFISLNKSKTNVDSAETTFNELEIANTVFPIECKSLSF